MIGITVNLYVSDTASIFKVEDVNVEAIFSCEMFAYKTTQCLENSVCASGYLRSNSYQNLVLVDKYLLI
jgi:hypothetical protein